MYSLSSISVLWVGTNRTIYKQESRNNIYMSMIVKSVTIRSMKYAQTFGRPASAGHRINTLSSKLTVILILAMSSRQLRDALVLEVLKQARIPPNCIGPELHAYLTVVKRHTRTIVNTSGEIRNFHVHTRRAHRFPPTPQK